MKRPTIRKATADEITKYAATKKLYPLYGFVKIDGQVCAVEDLRGEWSAPDPLYEIMIPTGFHVADELIHSMLCATIADARERAAYARLTPCTDAC